MVAFNNVFTLLDIDVKLNAFFIHRSEQHRPAILNNIDNIYRLPFVRAPVAPHKLTLDVQYLLYVRNDIQKFGDRTAYFFLIISLGFCYSLGYRYQSGSFISAYRVAY